MNGIVRDVVIFAVSLLVFILLFIIALGKYNSANAVETESRYKIAILDTGYDKNAAVYKLKTCKEGHFDYAKSLPQIGYTDVEHGTLVAETIARELVDTDYCAIIYQIAGPRGEFSTLNEVDALKRATKNGVIALNMSFRSNYFDYREYQALRAASDAGIKLFAAAGNENQNLDIMCNTFPACYKLKNLVVVGALTADGDAKASYSNYGQKVTLWYPGTVTNGISQARGTSFAAPRALGQYVHSLPVRSHH